MTRVFRTLPMLVLGALVAVAGLLSPTAAQAYPNAAFHGLDTGNRGVDVTAMQHLLAHHGQTVDADGVFDADTEAAVKAFQTEKGITADGLVGPQTWAALVPTLREGSSGEAVKALQLQLNAKRQLELAVDGEFSAAVTDAVSEFQDHAGLSVDGEVGATTWENLVWHYDYPDFASDMCNQDPDGNGEADWGTASAIGQLEEAARLFAETDQGDLPVGDLGFEHGGDIPGHGSHDVGLDADVWPIRTDDAQCTADRIIWESPEYDRDATRQLINAIREAAGDHLVFILFNDPVLIEEGLTVYEDNHDNHLHIRYCELGGAYSC